MTVSVFLRNLDPNKHYPVYGDDSTLVDDAPTRGKFYVRIERGDSSVLWGNFKTSINGTEFLRYDRGLYGARARILSDDATKFGERRGAMESMFWFPARPWVQGDESRRSLQKLRPSAAQLARGLAGNLVSTLMTLWTRNVVAGSVTLIIGLISATSPNPTYFPVKKAGFFAGHGSCI